MRLLAKNKGSKTALENLKHTYYYGKLRPLVSLIRFLKDNKIF